MRSLFVLFGISILFSCVKVVGEKELSELEQMKSECSKAMQKLGSIEIQNLEELNQWESEIDNEIQNIDFNLSFELGEMVFKFRDFKRYKRSFVISLKNTKKNLSVSSEQINALIEDISNGRGDRSKYSDQNIVERKRFKLVQEDLEKLSKLHDEILSIFNELFPVLLDRINLEKL